MRIDSVLAWSQQVTPPVDRISKAPEQQLTPGNFDALASSSALSAYSVRTGIAEQAEQQKRTLLFLENRYIKLMILPEIGGQVQILLDKSSDYDIVRESRLFKPALIGLSGPQIYNTHEFVWPSPWDPEMNKPLDWRIDEGANGSRTIWCAGLGVHSDLIGVNGFRLYPDRAYLEIDVQLYNGTSVPQSLELVWGPFTKPQSEHYWLRSNEDKRFTQIFAPFQENDPKENRAKKIAFLPLNARKVLVPVPALPTLPPEEITSSEELFLNGLYLEQHQHTMNTPYAPQCYYQEALRRDPFDSRCNNALGLLSYRCGRFVAAEVYFHKVIESLTRYDSSPADGESYYNLGLTLVAQGKYQSAADAFYKALWSNSLQDAACFELACLACRDGRLEDALELVISALQHNWTHHKARHLKIALLRRLQRPIAAENEIELALTLDVMAYGARWEAALLISHEQPADYRVLTAISQQRSTCIALALDYRHAGLWQEAIELLTLLQDCGLMVLYFLSWCHIEAGHPEAVDQLFATHRLPQDNGCSVLIGTSSTAATDQSIAGAFEQWSPSLRLDALRALQSLIHHHPNDASAFYLLGTLWYSYRQYELAIISWEQARSLNPMLSFIHRDLGIAYFNQLQDCEAALAAYERAFALDITNVSIFYELDQLYKLTNLAPQARLDNLELHDALVVQHDELTMERIRLLNLTGYHDEALELLAGCSCSTWVRKEGQVTPHGVAYSVVVYQRQFALIEQAKKLLTVGDPAEAIDKLYQARWSVNDPSQACFRGVQKTQIFFFLGCAFAALGEDEQALHSFLLAIGEPTEPDALPIYNEEPPEILFYQALARQKIGDNTTAEALFHGLIDYGKTHLEDWIQISFFASAPVNNISFEADINQQNRIRCSFMQGLGYLGLGMAAEAIAQFDMVLKLCSDHEGAIVHKRMVALTYA